MCVPIALVVVVATTLYIRRSLKAPSACTLAISLLHITHVCVSIGTYDTHVLVCKRSRMAVHETARHAHMILTGNTTWPLVLLTILIQQSTVALAAVTALVITSVDFVHVDSAT
eukprot:9242-Heterococcus_DN1.PRE.2